MENRKSIKIPREIQEYLWSRYLPETTMKMYMMVGYLQTENIKGEQATNILLKANLTEEQPIVQVIEEKKRVLKKLGFEYPKSRKDDIELLLKYKLIKIGTDKESNLLYVYNVPVPRPEESLKLDDEEINTLNNIKFEIKHQNSFNMLLTLLLNGNGTLAYTLDHIYNTTKVKLSDLKEILSYLVEEGSISVKADKKIKDIRKHDKVYISINKEVFEEKRFVIA